MISSDPSTPMVMSIDSPSTDHFLEAMRDGTSFDGAHSLQAQFTVPLQKILAEPRGSLSLVVSGTDQFHTHHFTIARAGVLRRSTVSRKSDELAIFPGTVMAGVLLRLAAVSPTEPLSSDVRVGVNPVLLTQIWAQDPTARTAAWAEISRISASLPEAGSIDLDSTPPRAVRLTRAGAHGENRTTVLLLRGRYLIAEEGALATTLVGTDPTSVSRALMSVLAPRR